MRHLDHLGWWLPMTNVVSIFFAGLKLPVGSWPPISYGISTGDGIPVGQKTWNRWLHIKYRQRSLLVLVWNRFHIFQIATSSSGAALFWDKAYDNESWGYSQDGIMAPFAVLVLLCYNIWMSLGRGQRQFQWVEAKTNRLTWSSTPVSLSAWSSFTWLGSWLGCLPAPPIWAFIVSAVAFNPLLSQMRVSWIPHPHHHHHHHRHHHHHHHHHHNHLLWADDYVY